LQEENHISQQWHTNGDNLRRFEEEQAARDKVQESLDDVRFIRQSLEKGVATDDGSQIEIDILKSAKKAIELGHETRARKVGNDQQRQVIERRIAQLEGIVSKWMERNRREKLRREELIAATRQIEGLLQLLRESLHFAVGEIRTTAHRGNDKAIT